jgi:hypothetical protein
MEAMLDLYQQRYDAMRPLWCFDERPCQLLGDTLVPLPLEPGKPLRQNYEYERHGVCSVLIAVQPHTGQRFAQVRKQRTALDYADFMQALVTAHCPKGGKIVLVQDNLNTHTPASFYQAFSPERAFALMQQVEMHYTPKKASWLNMAEIELSVLARQCLNRRIPFMEQLHSEVDAWMHRRNAQRATIRWQFTPELARDKFSRFYPNLS